MSQMIYDFKTLEDVDDSVNSEFRTKINGDGKIGATQIYDDGRVTYEGYYLKKYDNDGATVDYKTKGFGSDSSYDGATTNKNKRYALSYHWPDRNYIFSGKLHDVSKRYHGWAYSNWGVLDSTDLRWAAVNGHISEWDISGDPLNNDNTLLTSFWDGSISFFLGANSYNNKRINNRWIKIEGGEWTNSLSYPSSGNPIPDGTTFDLGFNDSVYKQLDFSPAVNSDGNVTSSIGYYGYKYGSQLDPVLNALYTCVFKKAYDANELIDRNDGYLGTLHGGFFLEYNWRNNYKPRAYKEYVMDARDIPNPALYSSDTRYVNGHAGKTDRYLSQHGKISLTSILKLNGHVLTIPTMIIAAECANSYEFGCNEWSLLHEEAINDIDKQLYTDTQNIRRSAAGWSADECRSGGKLAGEIIAGGNFPDRGEPSGTNGDMIGYTGLLSYENDLAKRRDWRELPVPVYESFHSDGNSTNINKGKAVTWYPRLYITPVSVTISR